MKPLDHQYPLRVFQGHNFKIHKRLFSGIIHKKIVAKAHSERSTSHLTLLPSLCISETRLLLDLYPYKIRFIPKHENIRDPTTFPPINRIRRNGAQGRSALPSLFGEGNSFTKVRKSPEGGPRDQMGCYAAFAIVCFLSAAMGSPLLQGPVEAAEGKE